MKPLAASRIMPAGSASPDKLAKSGLPVFYSAHQTDHLFASRAPRRQERQGKEGIESLLFALGVLGALSALGATKSVV